MTEEAHTQFLRQATGQIVHDYHPGSAPQQFAWGSILIVAFYAVIVVICLRKGKW